MIRACVIALLCGATAMRAQVAHRLRPIDSLATRGGKVAVIATNDGAALINARSASTSVLIELSPGDLGIFTDSAALVIQANPPRAARETIVYSIAREGLLLERTISDRGEAIELRASEIRREVRLPLNRDEARRLVAILRAASRSTAEMTSAEHPETLPGARGGVLSATDAGHVFFDFQVEHPARLIPGSPKPATPAMMRSAHADGEVVAQFIVDTNGRVEDGTFKVLKSSHVLFTQAVKDVLPHLRFTPADIAGHPVRQLVQMPFVFPAYE